MKFDPDRLLAALPRKQVALLPAGTVVPRRRSFGKLDTDYNGFTGAERMRTFGVSKWLIAQGAMHRPETCAICARPGDQSHAENYYDFATWIDICRGCHTRLHNRFKSPGRWVDHLDRLSIVDDHWTRLASPEPFDLASLLRARGVTEPVYESFVVLRPGPA